MGIFKRRTTRDPIATIPRSASPGGRSKLEQQESNFSVNKVFFRACISRPVSDKRPGQVISRAGVFRAGRVKPLALYIQKDRAAGIYRNVRCSNGPRRTALRRLCLILLAWTLAIVERNRTKRHQIKHTASFA